MHSPHAVLRACAFSGITLVETMVTLTIVATLLALSVPTFSSSLQRVRLASTTNDLLTDMAMARTASIQTGQRVLICKGTPIAGCQTGTSGWHSGWLVFIDRNRNGIWDASDPTETLIGTGKGDKQHHIYGNTHVRDYVAYTAQGYTRTHSGALQVGTITVCLNGQSQSAANRIVISRSGRARIERLDAFDCPAT